VGWVAVILLFTVPCVWVLGVIQAPAPSWRTLGSSRGWKAATCRIPLLPLCSHQGGQFQCGQGCTCFLVQDPPARALWSEHSPRTGKMEKGLRVKRR
jgi:hypothetical protein